MSVDGTYGKLSGHNLRFKELRRKKLDRRESKIWKNTSILQNNKKETHFKSVPPEQLNKIKQQMQKKVKRQLYIDLFVFAVSMILASLLFIFLFVK